MKIFAAPMQGLTDAVWRKVHADTFEAADEYYSPFLRVENGAVRAKELRDITSSLNAGIRLVPQAIFRSVDELNIIAEAVVNAGYRRLDLNLGCPFPPQMHRGRGAALVSRPDIMEQVARMDLGLELSVKMRPGVADFEEWRTIAPILNDMKLIHVTVHPRVASQGYRGAVNMDCFIQMASAIKHQLVYNGDIVALSQIGDYNNIYGVMIGRGLIARPSLVQEWRSGEEWSVGRRIEGVRQVLAMLLHYYSGAMSGGDLQVIKHIQPFMEYVDSDFPPRIMKRLRKAQSIHAFERALQELR